MMGKRQERRCEQVIRTQINETRNARNAGRVLCDRYTHTHSTVAPTERERYGQIYTYYEESWNNSEEVS